MSTPASFSRSIGYCDDPEESSLRYASRPFAALPEATACLADDVLGQRHAADHAGRVLVDVEVAVEMRNVGPLGRIEVRHLHHALLRAVVLAQQLEVQRVERFLRERLAALDRLVDLELELREHRLAEERLAHRVEVARQQEEPGVVVLRLVEHVVEQQALVQRRGDLGNEDRVIRGSVRLVVPGQPGMHRVSRLVRQRRNLLPAPVEVHQLVGMHAVDPVAVGARVLAGVRQEIHPARLVSLAQRVDVVLAERGE